MRLRPKQSSNWPTARFSTSLPCNHVDYDCESFHWHRAPIIFDLLLSGYVSSLEAYHNCSVNKSSGQGQQREEAISAAIRASQGFRDAETKRQTQLTDKANLIVEDAMASLKHRYGGFNIYSNIVSNHPSSNVSVDAIPVLHKTEVDYEWLGWWRRLKKYESSCTWFSLWTACVAIIAVRINNVTRLVLGRKADSLAVLWIAQSVTFKIVTTSSFISW